MPRTELEITVQEVDGTVVLTLSGEVDASNAVLVDAHLAQVIGDGTATPDRIVLELTDLTFIGSDGLGVLLRNRRRLQEGTELVLHNPSDHLERLLEVTALSELFPIRRQPPA